MKQIVLPEIVAVGVFNAQLVFKTKDISPRRKTTMFEIELPIEDGGVSYADNESSGITKDTVICAKPGQIRQTRLPFKCYYIHMMLTEGELYDRLMELPSYIKTTRRADYERIFKKLTEHYETALDSSQIIMQSLILELIYMLLEHCSSRSFKTKSSNAEMIEKSIRYIKDNLTADLSLNSVARVTSFSPIYFHNCFKRSTGKSLREFVEEARIQKSVNLLISTDMNLSEIAYECGFSSQSYFSYAFKRKMKMTPREYVKSIYQKYEK